MAAPFLGVPFASAGDKITIPTLLQPDGSVSFVNGWGTDYELVDTAPGYKPVGRKEMNGLFNMVTRAVGELQQNGYAEWQAGAAPYPLGAVVRSGTTNWRSTVTNNSTVPGAGPEWADAGTVPAASETVAGIAEIATVAEIAAGTDDARFVTALKLMGVAGALAHGKCRLKYVSATSIRLDPCEGNSLIVNGLPRKVPSAGVVLTNAGLAASTKYYVYAFVSAGVLTLEAVATGHSQDAASGIEIKTGDAARTLVGMIYSNASSQFADTPAARHVASWFNRRSVGGVLYRTGQIGFTNIGTMAEVSAADRVSFLSWADESTEIRAFGQYITGSSSNSVQAQSYVDGFVYGGLSSSYEPVANGGMVFASGSNFSIGGSPLAEGQHLAQIFAGVASGVSGGAITILTNSVMARI